jgi:succinoglycan biosynthesis transport protein ExoP
VLLDSPPVLGISDGSIIAHEVDCVLLVIQHRRYPRDISLRAKRAVQEVKGRLMGVVLNAVSIKSDDAYYYYSSYGDYYYGSKKDKQDVQQNVRQALRERKKAAVKNGGVQGSENF